MTLASLILVRNVASLPQCRNAAAAAFRSPASSHATIASPSFCSNRDSEDMDGASSLRPFPVHHTNLRNLEVPCRLELQVQPLGSSQCKWL
ncbi:Os08g0167332 [Oryza sativa Japonica Group]|uniref:Os08g0167332 protein n=1 Tax=Oryza sativa subsp. japonica TaxID=39947 RepID=A0A0N7KPC0_ORYSJ|nr:Os08g0167332 [Oryza sativa Japonica Group]